MDGKPTGKRIKPMRLGKRERLLIRELKRWQAKCHAKALAVKNNMPKIRLSCSITRPVNFSAKRSGARSWKWDHAANKRIRAENRM